MFRSQDHKPKSNIPELVPVDYESGLHFLMLFQGVSLLQSVAHELGHSLGLLHSSKYGAMMSPYHKVLS